MTKEDQEAIRRIVREELTRRAQTEPLPCDHAWLDYGYTFNHQVICTKCGKITHRNNYPGFVPADEIDRNMSRA